MDSTRAILFITESLRAACFHPVQVSNDQLQRGNFLEDICVQGESQVQWLSRSERCGLFRLAPPQGIKGPPAAGHP